MVRTGSADDVLSTPMVELAVGYNDYKRLNETLNEKYSKEVVIGVDLFAVVVAFAALLTLASVGTVANIAVLVVIKYRKRLRVAVHRDAVLCNLSIVHLFICLVLAPMEFATLIENYVKHSLPSFVCLARDCGFHLFIGVDVFSIVLLAVCQVQRLQRSCALTPSAKWEQLHPLLKFTLPWIVGACAAATSVAMPLFTRLGFEVCRKSTAFWEEVRRDDPWQLELLLGVIYFLSLIGVLTWLLVAIRKNRVAFNRIWNQADVNQESTNAGSEGQPIKDEKYEWSVSKDLGDDSGSPNPRPSLGGKRGSQTTASTAQKITEAQEGEDTEETDDTFDLKMRHEFQKKSRSSGRRHTVANIGLPDLADLRSKSFGRAEEGHSQTGYSSKTTEYHYVRKWSVDITALANQLENPKAHSDTSPFKEKENLDYEETFKGLREPSSACLVASCEYIGPTTSDKQRQGLREMVGGKLENSKCSDAEKETKELHSLEKHSGNLSHEKGLADDALRRSLSPNTPKISLGSEELEASGNDEGNDGEDPEPFHALAKPCLVDKQQDVIQDAKSIAKAAKELAATSRMIAVVIVSVFFTCPCFIVFLWLVIMPLSNLHLGYNLSLVAKIVITIQAAVNPLVLFWADRRLQHRLKNLLREASHLRCVCYCNIGNHGNCLQQKKGETTSRQPTIDRNRLQKI